MLESLAQSAIDFYWVAFLGGLLVIVKIPCRKIKEAKEAHEKRHKESESKLNDIQKQIEDELKGVRKENEEALGRITNSQMMFARLRLRDMSREILHKGCTCLDELEDLSDMLQAYKSLGGNSNAEREAKHCFELPICEEEKAEHCNERIDE